MPISDFFIVLFWWIVLLGIGLSTYPITYGVFNKLWDRGWGFSKIIGIGLLSYFVWIVGSLRILPFENFVIWIGVFALSYLSYLFYKKSKSDLFSFVVKNWRMLLFEEIIFGVLLILWSWVRAHQPDLNGLEKFMDFGFINSILRAKFFPPPDIWLAGETVNYYYFGHLIAAVLTKISGISSEITYNLMLASILALSFTATFSLASSLFLHLYSKKNNIYKFLAFLSGIISAVVLNFAGNLHTIFKVITEGKETYWYPDATRYIPFTIHEFPHYSYIVSDLHGHVSDIPFVLLIVALWFNFLLVYKDFSKSVTSPFSLFRYLLLGLIMAILYMTNALDAIIYSLLFALTIVLVKNKRLVILLKNSFSLLSVGVVGILALIFSLPFHLNFEPFAKGLKLVHTRSSLSQLFVLWGFFFFVGVVFVLIFLFQQKRQYFSRSIFNLLTAKFIFSIILLSAFLIVVPEFIYIKDIYIEDYHRANTMFKLVYQTFILMSLITGPVFVSLILVITKTRIWKFRLGLIAFFLVFFLGLGSVLMYPYFTIRSYYNRLQIYKGLDGLTWMEKRYPDDFAGLTWLQRYIENQPVILEAVGESYTDYARISANTGLPTVLGWRVHEWLWRGSFDIPGQRTSEVSTMYTSNDIQEVCRLINIYAVEYIFIGTLEREQYPNLSEITIKSMADLVYHQGNTKIYSVRKPCGS